MKRLVRRALALILSLMFSGHATLALAQIPEEEPSPDKSYGLPYLLVVLLVALGLIMVLRPSLRHQEVQEKRKKL